MPKSLGRRVRDTSRRCGGGFAKEVPGNVENGENADAPRGASRIVLDTLNGLEMTYPEVSAERRKELQSIRERLTNGDLD